MKKLSIYLNKLDNKLSALNIFKGQRSYGLIIVIIITIIGVRLLTLSHAQSPYVSSEVESGNLTGASIIKSDTNSSGGSYVRFGGPTAVRVNGNVLVDGNGKPFRLIGVNVPLTESQCVDSNTVAGSDPLDLTQAGYIASWKMNAVRVPLNEECWLGINGLTIGGQSAAASAITYQNGIKNWVSYLNSKGIIAILDLHWTAPGTLTSRGQFPMTDEDHSVAFWSQVASSFKSNPAVIYDLFNEPFLGLNSNITTDIPAWTCWLNGCNVTYTTTINGVLTTVPYVSAGMQQLVNTVRATGANQPIMIGGLHYSSDPCGLWGTYGSTGCPILTNLPNDPLKQLIVSYHNYYVTNMCNVPATSVTCWDNFWNAEFNPILAANIPVVTDEFGENNCDTTFMNTYMDWADQNKKSYLAWSWVPPNPGYTSCTVGDNVNWTLLSDWKGNPSTIIPQGPNYKSHLSTVSPY